MMQQFAIFAFAAPVALTLAGGMVASPAAAQTLDQLYQAAKKEGTVSVATAPNVEIRNALTKAFSARFPDVKAEIIGMAPPQLAAKMRAEAKGSVFSTDVIIGGTSAAYEILKPAKMLTPIDPWLVTADARDQSKWRGGKFSWGDDDHMTIALLGQSVPVAVINTDLVKPGQIEKDSDLLDPKWKGKLISGNPLVPGPTNVVYQAWYDLHGPDFLRKLAAQDVLVTRDLRQLIDFVASGKYVAALGPSTSVANALIQKGVKNIKPMGSHDWKDPLLLSPGFGAMMIPSKVPHPAAARLFVNWMMSKEGQTALSIGNGSASLRTDVPSDHVPDYLRLYDDAKYVEGYSERFIKEPSQKEMKELLTSLGWK